MPLVPFDSRRQAEEFLADVNYSVTRYDKGDILVHQGARCDKLLIVIKGKVQTEMADETGDFMTIETIKAPNPLTTGFLFATDNASPVTAVAKVDTVAVLIPKENIYHLMRKYPEFMKTYLSYLSMLAFTENCAWFRSVPLKRTATPAERVKQDRFWLTVEGEMATCHVPMVNGHADGQGETD